MMEVMEVDAKWIQGVIGICREMGDGLKWF
jgi:hypothetical protein